MKRILTLILLVICSNAMATNYYISTTGTPAMYVNGNAANNNGAVTLPTTGSGNFVLATGTVSTLTAGNATTLATARNINGSSFNGSADISTDIKTIAYGLMGSTIKAYNVDGDLAFGNSGSAMTSQRIYYIAVYLPVAATITGVKFIQTVQGNYTSNNYNGVGLFTYSAGTLTKVASSTDDGNIWKATASTMSSKAFSSTYAASAGLYFIALMYSSSAQVTAPSLGVINAASSVNVITDFTNSAITSSLITGQAALPATTQAMSGLTGATTEFKVYLY